MSGVPKGKRTESSFKVFHNAIALRKELTQYILKDMAVTGKLSEVGLDVLKEERKEILDDARNIISCIEQANSFYVIYDSELEARRTYQDLALGYCARLKCELNYICDNYSTKINMKKYGISSKMVDEEIGLIKAWRRSNKKIQKKLKK